MKLPRNCHLKINNGSMMVRTVFALTTKEALKRIKSELIMSDSLFSPDIEITLSVEKRA